jgi:hypothetical protein
MKRRITFKCKIRGLLKTLELYYDENGLKAA